MPWPPSARPRSWRGGDGDAQSHVPPAEPDGRGGRRQVPAGRPRQARLAPRHRARQRHPSRAQLRRQLRLHDVPRGRPRGRGQPLADGTGRGGPTGYGGGADPALPARVPGGGQGRRRRRDPEVGEESMTWKDAEDIALALLEQHPDVDPLSVRFTDLHRWVAELPGFADDPKASNEGILEAIQMKWVEEYRDR